MVQSLRVDRQYQVHGEQLERVWAALNGALRSALLYMRVVPAGEMQPIVDNIHYRCVHAHTRLHVLLHVQCVVFANRRSSYIAAQPKVLLSVQQL
jgi:hypothetical protein